MDMVSKEGRWANSEAGRASASHPSGFAGWVKNPELIEDGRMQFEMLLPPEIRAVAHPGSNARSADSYLENYFPRGSFLLEDTGNRSVIVTLQASEVPFFNALMVEEHSHDERPLGR